MEATDGSDLPTFLQVVFVAWLAAAVCIAAVWLFRFSFILLTSRDRCRLSAASHLTQRVDRKQGSALPRLSVLVAAKDEERNIEACVRSLLAQDYPAFEVIVSDDRSTDRTPEILRKLAGEARAAAGGSRPRLRVLTVDELPAGWCGKNHAMHLGAAAADGEWLVFTDADCRMTCRRTLRVAMREALAHDLDFLSIIPILETPTGWEKVLQPACGMLLILWFLPHRVNDPSRKTAYANGAFMLMQRTCYEAIGGHARVRAEVNEDVQMARFAKRLGLRLRVVENDDLYSTRMYATPLQAWRGWSRILYGCLGTMRRLAISAAMVLGYTILPWVSLIVAFLGLALAAPSAAVYWKWAVGLWGFAVAGEQLALWRVYRDLRMGGLWSLAHVAGAAVTLGMLANAALKVIGATGTEWRGTSYRAGGVEAGKPAGANLVGEGSIPKAATGEAPDLARARSSQEARRSDFEPALDADAKS